MNRRRHHRGRSPEAFGVPDPPLISSRAIFLLALTALVLTGAIILMVLLRKGDPAPPSPPPLTVTERAEITENLGDRAALHDLLEKFLAATTPEEKAPLVRGGTAMLPALRAYYAKRPDEPPGYKPGPATAVETILGRKFTLFGGRDRFDAPLETVAEHLPDGPRLDWRCLTGAGGMEWEDWLRDRPRQPVTMRGHARRDEFYEGPFADKAKWFCFKVTDASASFTVWAYLLRDTVAGRRLQERLYDAQAVERVSGRFVFPEQSAPFAQGTPQVEAEYISELGWMDEEVPENR